MKTNDKIITELNEVIQYFINHKDNEPKTEFCNNVDKLINLQADLANGAEQRDSNCNIPDVIGLLPSTDFIGNMYKVDNNWSLEDRAHAIGKREGARWMLRVIKERLEQNR